MTAESQLVDLIEALSEADLRLEKKTGGVIDMVVAKDGRNFLLQHAQVQLSRIRTAILDAISDSLALLSADGTIIAVNEAWRRFGNDNALQTAHHAIGSNYLAVCDMAQGQHGSEAPLVSAGIRAVLSGSSAIYSLEYPCHSPTQERWFMLRATPVADQWPVGALVVHIDITARKNAEEAVHHALEAGLDEFKALASSMPQMVWTTRADGWNTYFNQQWFDYTGLTSEESHGHGWNKPFHPDDQAVAWKSWRKATKTGGGYSIECRLRRADGVYRWWLVRGVPQLDANGEIRKWYGTCTDIHDLKEAQLSSAAANVALTESEQKFSQFADVVTDVFFVAAADTGKVLYVNPAFETIFGIPRSSLYADPDRWPQAILSSQREQVLAAEAQLGADTPMVSLEYQIRQPNGNLRWISSQRFAILDSAGTMVRIAGIARDTTDYRLAAESLKELNERLEARVHSRTVELERARLVAQQANEAKTTFLATVSHEIRTPMNGVIGMLELLHQTSLEAKQLQMLRVIEESATALLDIIEDILDFSKIEAGKLQLSAEPMSLGDVIRRSCDIFHSVALKQNVQLTLYIAPDLPVAVIGDDKRLRQIVINLVSNAIKFSGGSARSGKVSVRCGVVKLHTGAVSIELTVADNGIGIDDQTLQRLFQPFVQADASTARRFGGTGLGLAIAQSLIGMMGGTISVRSEVERGAIFTVHLKCRVCDVASTKKGTSGTHSQAATTSRPQKHHDPDLQEQRILVAEDNETNLIVIMEQLRAIGLDADIARNGREALVRWRQGGIALVLTDLHMPEMDGHDLAASIRAEEAAGNHLPIIALTANASRDEEQRCLAQGMDAYLTKPIRLPRLKAALEQWLGALPGGGLLLESDQLSQPDTPLDLSVLVDLVGDHPTVIRKVLTTFGQSADRSSREILDAVNAQSMTVVADVAHRLKSGARSIGARHLGETCALIEQAAESGRTDQLNVLLPRFRSELDAVMRVLARQ